MLLIFSWLMPAVTWRQSTIHDLAPPTRYTAMAMHGSCVVWPLPRYWRFPAMSRRLLLPKHYDHRCRYISPHFCCSFLAQGTPSFSQYPLFIVDHPQWEDDHPMRPRNIQDQATFNSLMREAEMKKDRDLPLSGALRGVEAFTCLNSALNFRSCSLDYILNYCIHLVRKRLSRRNITGPLWSTAS